MTTKDCTTNPLAVNEMGALWDQHVGQDGKGETDRLADVAAHRAGDQAALKDAHAEIARLRIALAESESFAATLQDLLDNARVDSKLWAEACLLRQEL